MVWASLLGFICVVVLMVLVVRIAEIYKKELPTKGRGNNRGSRRHKKK